MPDIVALTPESLYPGLKILRVRVGLKTSEKLPSDFYLGSTWRGILGWELQHLVCPYPRLPGCERCSLQNSCPYFVLFEKKSDLPGIQDAPRGYIFFSQAWDMNKEIFLEITLLGYCAAYFPAVFQALARAQNKGLGKSNIMFSVTSVTELTPDGAQEFDLQKDILSRVQGPFELASWLESSEDNGNIYRMKIRTPLRLRQKGKYISQMQLSFMFMVLARRLGAISYIFQGLEFMDKAEWLELKGYFEHLDGLPMVSSESEMEKSGIFNNLKWDDFARFSNRQKKKVPMGGLVGECVFVADLPGIGKWIKCAELLHIGKGAAMGLGRVEQVH